PALSGSLKTVRRGVAVAAMVGLVFIAAAAVTPQLNAGVQRRLEALFLPASSIDNTTQSRLWESKIAVAQLVTPVDWVIGVGLGLPSAADGVHTFQHDSYVWLLSKEGLLGLALGRGTRILLPPFP